MLDGATEDASAATSELRGVAWRRGEGHNTANIEVEGVVKEVEGVTKEEVVSVSKERHIQK